MLRRRFLVGGAMAMAAAQLGAAHAQERESRELAALGRAIEWLNSPRLTSSTLAGKPVLVNFCTYTCINWLRTLPHVRAWARKYSPRLTVIGVHTPEFGFEKNLENVRRAVRQLRIDYPVAVDNDYAIWRAFKNQYWPALYFIDARGRVRQSQFGEGSYDQSVKHIQRLLADAGTTIVGDDVSTVEATGVEAAADWANLKTPETYVGYDRTQNFASRGGVEPDRRLVYAIPARLALNQWALAGDWTIASEAAASHKAGGRVAYRFHARDLHLVMGLRRPESPVRFRLSIDGKPPGPANGLDVAADGRGTVGEQRLYQLIRQPKPIADRTFEIEFDDAGVEIFAFTFG